MKTTLITLTLLLVAGFAQGQLLAAGTEATASVETLASANKSDTEPVKKASAKKNGNKKEVAKKTKQKTNIKSAEKTQKVSEARRSTYYINETGAKIYVNE